jgi:hypothetical protein
VQEAARSLRDEATGTDTGCLDHRLPISAEAIEHALADHPNNPRGLTPSEATEQARLKAAIDRFRAEHERYGGWRFHGRPDAINPRGYAGPLFWKKMSASGSRSN